MPPGLGLCLAHCVLMPPDRDLRSRPDVSVIPALFACRLHSWLIFSTRSAIIASNTPLRRGFPQRHVCWNSQIAGIVRCHQASFNSRLSCRDRRTACGGFRPEPLSAILTIGLANTAVRLTPARHMNLLPVRRLEEKWCYGRRADYLTQRDIKCREIDLG